MKECSEVHTFTRFRFPGLPTSCIDFKRALQWFIWHLYKGPQSTEGPHRQGLQRISELYLCWETKDTRDNYWVIATHVLSFAEPVGSHFYPAGLTCAMFLQIFWRWYGDILERQNCGSSLRHVPLYNVNVSMMPRDILIHQLSGAVSVEGEDGKSETWTLLTSNKTPRLSAELKSMTNIRNRHFTQSCMYCTKPLTHSLFIMNVTPFT